MGHRNSRSICRPEIPADPTAEEAVDKRIGHTVKGSQTLDEDPDGSSRVCVLDTIEHIQEIEDEERTIAQHEHWGRDSTSSNIISGATWVERIDWGILSLHDDDSVVFVNRGYHNMENYMYVQTNKYKTTKSGTLEKSDKK